MVDPKLSKVMSEWGKKAKNRHKFTSEEAKKAQAKGVEKRNAKTSKKENLRSL